MAAELSRRQVPKETSLAILKEPPSLPILEQLLPLFNSPPRYWMLSSASPSGLDSIFFEITQAGWRTCVTWNEFCQSLPISCNFKCYLITDLINESFPVSLNNWPDHWLSFILVPVRDRWNHADCSLWESLFYETMNVSISRLMQVEIPLPLINILLIIERETTWSFPTS